MSTMLRCELSTPPGRRTAPQGGPFSPIKCRKRRGSEGELDIFGPRRQNVHSVSYSDLLSGSFLSPSSKAAFKVAPSSMQKPIQSKLAQKLNCDKTLLSAAKSCGKTATPTAAKGMAKSASAVELPSRSSGLSSVCGQAAKNSYRPAMPPICGALPPICQQASMRPTQGSRLTQSTGNLYDTPGLWASQMKPSAAATPEDWASQTLVGLSELTPKNLVPRQRDTRDHKVNFSRTEDSYFSRKAGSYATQAQPFSTHQSASCAAQGDTTSEEKTKSKSKDRDPLCSDPFSPLAMPMKTSTKPKADALDQAAAVATPTQTEPSGPKPKADALDQAAAAATPTQTELSGPKPKADSETFKTPVSSPSKKDGCGTAEKTCKEGSEAVTIKQDEKQVSKQSANEEGGQDVEENTMGSKLSTLLNATSAGTEKKPTPMLWKKALSAAKRNVAASKLFQIEGAPVLKDAVERLLLGLMTADESKRVHQVFNRFSHGEEDLERPVLDHVILHLGYILEDEDIVDTIAGRITDLSSFDLKELFGFLDEFATAQRDMLENVYNKWATTRQKLDGTESKPLLSINKIHLVMRDLQIMIQSDVLEELLQRAEQTGKLHLDFEGLAFVVAAYRLCEGFTSKELKEAKEAFDKATEESEAGILTTEDLPNALLDFFGVHCIKHLRELVETVGDALGEPTAFTSAVSFHEYLIWARRLRNAELFQLLESFQNSDLDDDDMLTFDELLSFMKQEGFTLELCEANEFLDAANLRSHKSFSFEDALAYLEACRKSEGFSAQDLEECTEAYNKFDVEEEGELTTMQVLDLLRYLGYEVQVEDVERYANEVDFNGNGTMDVNEYLRLMRLHREDEVDGVDRVFHVNVDKNGRLAVSKLHQALKEARVCSSHCDVFDELEIKPGVVDLSFDEFRDLARSCRTHVKAAQRKKGAFSDEEFTVLRKTFNWYDLQGKGILDKKPLSNLLFQSGILLHTSDHRNEALAMLDRARQAALDADVPPEDVGPFGVFAAPFWVMVHAWRIITRENESKRVERLDKARQDTGFSLAEATEFQEIFNDRIKREHGGEMEQQPDEDINQGRRQSMPELQVSIPQLSLPQTAPKQQQAVTLESILSMNNESDMLSFDGLKKVLGHLKLKLSAGNHHKLQMQLKTITGHAEASIDSAGFLYLMRWMLDTNFAHLNENSAVIAKSEVLSPKAGDAKKTDLVTPLPQLQSTKFCRRASI